MLTGMISAVAMVAELALAYRQNFGEDVVIDVNCYRKHGTTKRMILHSLSPTLSKNKVDAINFLSSF